MSRKNGVLLIQKRKTKILSSLLHRLTREIGIALTVSFFGSTDGTDKTIKIVAISFFKHKDAFQILDAKVSFMHFVRYKEAHASYLHFWNQVYVKHSNSQNGSQVAQKIIMHNHKCTCSVAHHDDGSHPSKPIKTHHS